MPDQDYSLPPHLAPLLPPDWGLWKWFALRGAGFPARLAQMLSEKECSFAADQLAASDAALPALYRQAIHLFDSQLDVLKRDHGVESPLFRAALKARRRAQTGNFAAADARAFGMNPLAEEIEKTLEHQARCRQTFQELFSSSLKHQSRQLWNVARDT